MKKPISLLLLTILLSACGLNSEKLPPQPTVTDQVAVDKVWSSHPVSGDTKQYNKFTPTLVNQEILLADDKGHLAAINKNTGENLWHLKNKQQFSSAPSYGENKVYIGTANAEVFALDNKNGKTLWKTTVSNQVIGKPAYGNGIVVVKTLDGKLVALNSVDGKQIWNYDEENPELILKGESSPIIYEGKVLAGFPDGKLLVLNLADGSLVWEANVADSQGFSSLSRMIDINATPVISDGIVYIATYQGNISAFDLNSGSRIWEHRLSAYSGLAVDAKDVYVTDASGVLWAFNKTRGNVDWKQTSFKKYMLSGPTVFHNYLVVGDNIGNVHVFAKSDGKILAQQKISTKPIYVSPLTDDKTVYLFSSDGRMTAIKIG